MIFICRACFFRGDSTTISNSWIGWMDKMDGNSKNSMWNSMNKLQFQIRAWTVENLSCKMWHSLQQCKVDEFLLRFLLRNFFASRCLSQKSSHDASNSRGFNLWFSWIGKYTNRPHGSHPWVASTGMGACAGFGASKKTFSVCGPWDDGDVFSHEEINSSWCWRRFFFPLWDDGISSHLWVAAPKEPSQTPPSANS